MNAAASRAVCWFDDPGVSFGLCLLELHKMCVKLIILIRQNVGVGDKVVLLDPKFLLCFHEVKTESILSRNLVTHREVINSLKLVQAFIEVRFAG